jgi:hypothetical protein
MVMLESGFTSSPKVKASTDACVQQRGKDSAYCRLVRSCPPIGYGANRTPKQEVGQAKMRAAKRQQPTWLINSCGAGHFPLHQQSNKRCSAIRVANAVLPTLC